MTDKQWKLHFDIIGATKALRKSSTPEGAANWQNKLDDKEMELYRELRLQFVDLPDPTPDTVSITDNSDGGISTREIMQLYLGRKFMLVFHDASSMIAVLSNINVDGSGWLCGDDVLGAWFEVEPFKDCKAILPFLYDVSNMRKDEKATYRAKCKIIRDKDGQTVWIADTPESIRYLVMNGYDAFDLLETGKAIELQPAPEK